ncbi:RNA-directed DNA polymerase, eukaryota, reverse transcriptase zinc-binding domain protein [Tanacetum coccineum]
MSTRNLPKIRKFKGKDELVCDVVKGTTLVSAHGSLKSPLPLWISSRKVGLLGWNLKAYLSSYGQKKHSSVLHPNGGDGWTTEDLGRIVTFQENLSKETPGWVPDFTDEEDENEISDTESKDDDLKVDDQVTGIHREEEDVPETLFEEAVGRNMTFEFVHSDSNVNPGGILCRVDPNAFLYAPHDAKEKIMLWDYLASEINRWRGKVVVMGDFNKVRFRSDRFGSIFNAKGANVFNSFISNAWRMRNLLLLLHVINKNKRNVLAVRGIMIDGLWIDDPSLVKTEFLHHFSHRFAKPDCSRATLHSNFPNRLTSSQQSDLERDVSKDEIKRAVWDCGTDKSPGPDGFTFGFYRRFWYLIENDVYKAVSYFFLFGDIPKGANMVKDFCPISLIGSLYKIIAKVLANRLVDKLGLIVNEVQSAFVKDRQILDGPFILDEPIQWCKKKRKHLLVFKVDFEKAFDSVRWDFLDDLPIWEEGGYGMTLWKPSFHRLYALELCKDCTVASKISIIPLISSFRRPNKRSGVTRTIHALIIAGQRHSLDLLPKEDRLSWSLSSSCSRVYKNWDGGGHCFTDMESDGPMTHGSKHMGATEIESMGGQLLSQIHWKVKDAEGPSLDESLENVEHLDVDSCDTRFPSLKLTMIRCRLLVGFLREEDGSWVGK